ncbi:HAMP domain-containing sensor histidine kinase [Clostridium weizhouense]|uniref:histidine kinase n=1 Tax=Clostridium weizhouense TaxID=2859781 RepID=A0ABS7AJG4_9CLOT|nr:HAMP domain-containing sensor histidine kinase [Clostridium weizhouense]MBW6408694.1 HAMP domain-containing histidine kinase [Clostridium weizhouense]
MKINFKIGNKKLDVKGFLILNYLITFLILYILVQLSYKSSTFILEKFIFKDEQIRVTSMVSYYNKDFDKIKLGFLSEMDAWEEVLDENKNVIYVKGEKKDDIIHYTEKQLFELASSSKYSPENPYIGEIFSVKGKNEEDYIFLCKIDRRNIEHSFMYKPNFSSKSNSLLSLKAYGTLYLIQALLLIISIYIYSIISSRFITTPLKTFVNSIKNFKKLDYGTRANIKGLKELQEVQSEFNEMVIELETIKEQNKKMDKSKKRLLVDISHDLKTPITSIQGFSKLLLEENITPEERDRFLKIIYNKSAYSAILIEDLFALSKLEDSEYKLSLVELDFNEWLRRLIVEYYEEFQNKHFDLSLNISEYSIIFSFDKKLMKRAISNIFNNALSHNENYASLNIQSYLKDNHVILEIGSNGEIIDTSIGETIFEPFVKSENSNSSGSGLGLAITKKIIEKHGGTINLTSTKFENILFVISIPIRI